MLSVAVDRLYFNIDETGSGVGIEEQLIMHKLNM